MTARYRSSPLSRGGARVVTFLVLLLCASLGAFAANLPALTGRIVDQANVIPLDTRNTLEPKLIDLETKSGIQLVVATVTSLGGEEIEPYANELFRSWKLGEKTKNNGVLLLVAPNERRVRIEVGYGLEGALNDATSSRIIRDVIVPRFKQDDFYGGISAGVDSIIRVVNGEPLPAPAQTRGEADGIGSLLPILFVMAVVAGGLLRALLGRLPGAVVTGGIIGVLAWVLSGAIFVAVVAGAIALIFTLVGGGIGAYVGGRYIGGPGGFGDRSNRDIFRGGGGGFGGGGASGRW